LSNENGPAPLAQGETGPENVAATKTPGSAVHSTARQAESAPPAQTALQQMLRDVGMRQAIDGTDTWTKSCWQTGIDHWASTGLPFGADEIRDLGVPEPSSPNVIGALFMANCRWGIIKPAGFVQSRRRSRHAGWQRQWVGGDAG
jgi:hypothetical protein